MARMPEIPPGLSDRQIRKLLSEIHKQLATRRMTATRECQSCGVIMQNVMPSRRTCSDGCRVNLHYWEKKALTDPSVAHRLRLERKGWLPIKRRNRSVKLWEW